MARTVVIDGIPFSGVPDNVSDEEVRGRAMQAARQFDRPNPIKGMRQQLAQQTGPVQTALIEASQFLADRGVPGFDQIPPGIREALREESPISTFAGGAVFPILAGVVAPAKIGAQALTQGGIEALREGSTVSSTLTTAALAGAGTGVANQVGRIFGPRIRTPGGVQQTVAERAAQSEATGIAGAFERSLGRIGVRGQPGAQAIGAFDEVAEFNQKFLNGTVAKSFGQNADNLSPEVLLKGSEEIGSIFNSITPKSLIMDTRSLVDEFAEIVGKIGSRAKGVVGKEMPTNINGSQWTNLRAALAQRARKVAGTDAAAADDINQFISQMDEVLALNTSADDLPLLRIAREAWKNLKIAESMPSVVRTGNVTPAQLSGKLARAYETSFIRDTGKVLPETQSMFNTVREINRLQPLVGDSGTATRILGSVGNPIGALARISTAPTLGRMLTRELPEVSRFGFGAGQLGGPAGAITREQLLGEEQDE